MWNGSLNNKATVLEGKEIVSSQVIVGTLSERVPPEGHAEEHFRVLDFIFMKHFSQEINLFASAEQNLPEIQHGERSWFWHLIIMSTFLKKKNNYHRM